MPINQFLDRLSTHLKNTIARAISLATSMQHAEVSPTHLLLAIIDEPGAVAAEILFKFKIEKKYLSTLLEKKPKDPPSSANGSAIAQIAVLNPVSKQALEKAMLSAYEREHNFIGTEHLLFGLVSGNGQEIANILRDYKISVKEIIHQIEIVLDSISRFPTLDEISDTLDQIQEITGEDSAPINIENKIPKKNTPTRKRPPTAQEIFTVELTNKERTKKLDPVIGREKEIERLINILCRRNKNNPVLIGEPGVGKTAIVEGLAKKIVAGEVPDILKRKKIFSLDLALLISGTIYRGEFEARLKQLIDDFSARPDAILFIDELHNIIGAGSNQGTMDAANILKPALARGELRCIGATTIDEYKKYIASDPALERRFQPISVNEPTVAETIQILQGVKKNYENFHAVTLTDEAIQTAVELSNKYIHDYFLPDKAIDLIDEASAAARAKRKSTKEEEKMHQLTEEWENCLEQKEMAIREEKFEDAKHWKEKSEKIQKTLNKMEATNKRTTNKSKKKTTKINRDDIVRILADKIQTNEENIVIDEWEKLNTLNQQVAKKIIGQDEVITKIAQALKSGHLGLNVNGNGPFASFLFAGPSGVGKTILAKTLAEELFLDPNTIIKLDMSEFAEAHGISKLLGSPAGYVGYKERNRFLDSLRARPYSVVLFDEFDKAHADVRKLLWQILDEGELTDSAGKKTSFRHAIVILTSNVGADLYKSTGIGFASPDTALAKLGGKGVLGNGNLHDSITVKLKEEFGAALLGRIKNICIFNSLTHENIKKIIANRVDEISRELVNRRQISIVPDQTFLQSITNESFDEDLGARNAEQYLEKILNDLIVKKLSQDKGNEKKEYKLIKDEEYRLI